MKLSDIKAAVRPATVPVAFEDDEVEVVYNARACTGAWAESVVTAPLDTVLGAILISWDVQDDAGQSLAPNPELLKALPYDFKNAVFDAIWDDLTGGKGRAGASVDSSPPAD